MGLALLHSEQAVRVERMEKLIFTRVHAEAGPGVVTGNTFAIQNSLYLEQFPFSLNHCFFFLQKKKKKRSTRSADSLLLSLKCISCFLPMLMSEWLPKRE